MDLLRGDFTANIDNRGRITLPRQCNALLESGTFIMRSIYGNSLCVYPSSYIEKLLRVMEHLDNGKNDNFPQIKETLSPIMPFVKGKDGRYTIPVSFVKYANLKKEIVIVAMGYYLEIWDEDAFNAYMIVQAEKLASTMTKINAESQEMNGNEVHALFH